MDFSIKNPKVTEGKTNSHHSSWEGVHKLKENLSYHGLVCGNNCHFEFVYALKFCTLGSSCASHAT